MTSPTSAELVSSLRGVLDPCSIAMAAPTDVLDMGLIERVELKGSHARVEMVLTDPFDYDAEDQALNRISQPTID